jgi:phosphate transport system substrate-binding protein
LKPLALLACLTLIGPVSSPAVATELSIPGAGPPTQLLRALAAEFNRRSGSRRIEVPATVGMSGALEAARVPGGLARAPRRLTEEERRSGLRQIVIAREAIVFATGADVTVTDVSRAQLAAIFSGRVADWAAVGGKPGPIRVFYRHDSADSLNIIRSQLPEFARLEFSPNGRLLNLDREMIEQLERFGWGVGWGSAGNVRAAKGLRVLALDGVTPGAESLRSGRYPLSYELVLIHRDPLTGTAAAFVEFLASREGRGAIEAFGAIPAPDTPTTQTPLAR